MIVALTWTWNTVIPDQPETNPPTAEPEPADPRLALRTPASLARLMAGLFDSFRDEPEIYRRLAAIVNAWREGRPIVPPARTGPS